MKVVIIEDELPAVEKLERYLLKFNREVEVLARLGSVAKSVAWLHQHLEQVDLLFMDIQLTDGLSFEIFSHLTINKPVIFTTAYDEYAVDAFKVNSIDYILKPVTFPDLSNALRKLDSIKAQFASQAHLPGLLRSLSNKRFKSRFVVKLGNHIHSIKTNEIALFYAEGRTVFLLTNENKKFIIAFKLEELEQLLDPKVFYRVNRSFILNINAIQNVAVYSNSRLSIAAKVQVDKEIVVSREKVAIFKEWLAGEQSS